MDIFTDASLNDKKKIAGVSAIFVPSENARNITCYNSYCSVNKIETAELFAIAMALSLINPSADKRVRIVSDSRATLRKIQRIFHHPDQKQIHTLKDSIQKKIMYSISHSFSKIWETAVSFHCIHGHQHKVQETTDAYYNAIADQVALEGRMNGEAVYQQEKENHIGISTLSAEERLILNQPECRIVSPEQISFNYNDVKVKKCARRHPKSLFVREFCKAARSR